MAFTYDEVLEKIETSRRFGRLPGVEVTGRILKALGEPQRGLPYVHVAGTNGKGSVCAFLDAILRELGLKTGRFTSPHLVDYRERITVEAEPIGRGAVERIGNRLLAMDFGVSPTMFDYCLAMAVLYFKEQGCDAAVIETGLGGRLDSTNALGTPEAAVITKIGYDHMEVLGDSLAAIAGEKAGIIKAGVPAVSAPQEPEALQVLKQAGAIHVVTDEEVARARSCKPGIAGVCQWENAAVAAAAVRALRGACAERKGQGAQQGQTRMERVLLETSAEELEEAIARGIRGARWPGRMELLSSQPFFLVDGAHNEDGARALRESLMLLYPDERFYFVMGVMADKAYGRMAEILLPLAEGFATVTPESGRALRGEELAADIRGRGVPARALGSVRDIFSIPAEGRRTVAFGSLFLIGEIKRLYPLRL